MLRKLCIIFKKQASIDFGMIFCYYIYHMPANDNNSGQQEVMDQLKALGYIDPGAGSSVWQSVLAGFFSITSRLRRMFGKKDSEDDED